MFGSHKRINIKLKALLITTAILGGLFGFVYLMVFYPAVLALLFLAGTFYGLYQLVLNTLEKRPRKNTVKSYTADEFNKEFGEPK